MVIVVVMDMSRGFSSSSYSEERPLPSLRLMISDICTNAQDIGDGSSSQGASDIRDYWCIRKSESTE